MKISNIKTDCWHFSKDWEWAYFHVNEWPLREGQKNKGFTLVIHSSFGTWGYGWSSPGCDWRTFLKNCNFDYLAEKLTTREFQQDALEKGLKRHILTYRYDEMINAETARELWGELIRVLENFSGESIMHVLYYDRSSFWCQDPEVFDCGKDTPLGFKHFMKFFWEEFTGHVNKVVENPVDN